MKGLKKVVVLMAAFLLNSASLGGKCVGAQVHHVVGGDRGWDVDSDIASWSSGQVFGVGDKIWFAYSAAYGNIVELKNKEEYEACDVSKFIRKFTDGIEIVPLDGEGIRYFASSEAESCKKGLKLHVQVQSRREAETTGAEKANGVSYSALAAVAPPPSTPSSASSPPTTAIFCLAFFVFGLSHWIS